MKKSNRSRQLYRSLLHAVRRTAYTVYRHARGCCRDMPAQPTAAAAAAATANRSDGAELAARKSSRLSIVGRQSRGDREGAEEWQLRRRSKVIIFIILLVQR